MANGRTNGHLNGSVNGNSNGVNRIEGLFSQKPEKESIGPDLSIKRIIEPRTPNQKLYLKSIRTNDITICTGCAGCGKTALGIGYAAQALSKGQAERIILVRPAVSTDEDLGFLPGDLQAKLGSYLRPAYDELLEFFTVQQLNVLTGGKFPIIEGAALGQIKGRTFKNAIVILDEAQDATYKQLKNFLTRMGENTKVIITGDITQSDTFDNREITALEQVMERLEGSQSIAFVRMGPQDIQRHPRIEQILSRL